MWLVVMMMAVMIVGVNYVLLSTHGDDGDGQGGQSPRPRKFHINDKDHSASKQRLIDKIKAQQEANQQHLANVKHHHHEMLSVEKDPTVQVTKTDEELGPILDILRHADINDTTIDSIRGTLPTWEQVTKRYGEEPIIYGLETCPKFNDDTPLKKRLLGPAGPFNSGTNLLWAVLRENCRIAGRKDRLSWQVNWGKHQPPRFRFDNVLDDRHNNSHFMPVIPVRDPYTWMHSMCKHRYTAQWLHGPEHCPNLIPLEEVEGFYHNKSRNDLKAYFKGQGKKVLNVWQRAQYKHGVDKTVPIKIIYKNGAVHHQSLIDMWKEWYQEYWDADFPRIFIRLEDLVFHPEPVLKQICECVGGKFIGEGNLKLAGESPKDDQSSHGPNPTGLATAMISHIFSNRTAGMTPDDIKYVQQVLEDSIYSEFGYHPPV